MASSGIDRYRRIADRCRRIPGEMGLREHAVYLVSTEWSGSDIGDGTETTTETQLVVYDGENPKVQFPNQKELAMGMMQAGTVIIGPITPEYTLGGVDRTTLDGTQPLALVGRHIRVIGPQCPRGTLFRVTNVDMDQAIHFAITAVPAEG